MLKYLPEGLIASLGASNAVILAAAGQPPQTVAALTSLIVALGGCLVWVIKYVLGTTIPQIHAQNAANIQKICTTFEERGKEDREVNRQTSQAVVQVIGKLADKMENMETALFTRKEPHENPGKPDTGPSAGQL